MAWHITSRHDNADSLVTWGSISITYIHFRLVRASSVFDNDDLFGQSSDYLVFSMQFLNVTRSDGSL